jgi:hypothetical protein
MLSGTAVFRLDDYGGAIAQHFGETRQPLCRDDHGILHFVYPCLFDFRRLLNRSLCLYVENGSAYELNKEIIGMPV